MEMLELPDSGRTGQHEMKKSVKPVGRSPVIYARVPYELHKRIKASARQAKRPMSEFMAEMLGNAFNWQDTFREAQGLMAESKRLIRDNLKAEMRRQGWTPLHGSPYWLPPGVVPTSGWIKAEVSALERRITALKSAQTEDAS
jgi:hypothetical protein